MAKTSLTANDLYHLIDKKYTGAGWAVLPEVRSQTGYGRSTTRYADALVIGLWPSRGMDIEGFEIKISRSDWLHELRKPEKANVIAAYCDYWWVVVADEKIVQDDLPRTWGLMAPQNGKLRVVVQAPKLEPRQLDRTFVAAICRKAEEVIHDEDVLDDARRKGWAEGYEEGKLHTEKLWQAKLNLEKQRAETAAKTLEDFRSQTGILSQIGQWNAKEIGATVDMVLHRPSRERLISEARDALNNARKFRLSMDGSITRLEELVIQLNKNLEKPEGGRADGRQSD